MCFPPSSYAETPRHTWTGVLIGSLSVAFAFEINASQLGAVSGHPSTGRASRSRGTCTMTIQASPSTEEVNAPRLLPGVCAEMRISNELDVSFVLGQHGRVLTSGPEPANPANAIPFSRDWRESITLTHIGQAGRLSAWTRRNAPRCDSARKTWKTYAR